MKNTFNTKILFQFYHSAVKAELKKRGFAKDTAQKIKKNIMKLQDVPRTSDLPDC